MSEQYDMAVLKAFQEVTGNIMAKFPEPRHFENVDVCEAMADMAALMFAYFTAHAAIAHALDHPDVGAICAHNMIDTTGEEIQHIADISFTALSISLEDRYPGLMALLKHIKDEDVNTQTRNEILAMMKDSR